MIFARCASDIRISCELRNIPFGCGCSHQLSLRGTQFRGNLAEGAFRYAGFPRRNAVAPLNDIRKILYQGVGYPPPTLNNKNGTLFAQNKQIKCRFCYIKIFLFLFVLLIARFVIVQNYYFVLSFYLVVLLSRFGFFERTKQRHIRFRTHFFKACGV